MKWDGFDPRDDTLLFVRIIKILFRTSRNMYVIKSAFWNFLNISDSMQS